MAIYSTLSWQNENTLTGFPLVENLFAPDIITDAKFIQFDNFTPHLNSILVDSDSLILSITFDFGTLNSLKFLKSTYISGSEYHYLRIYTPDQKRYVGSLTFGKGLTELWQSFVGRKYTINKAFLKSTVISIPKKDGVYTFNSLSGSINLSRLPTDSTIFYNVYTAKSAAEYSSITFNAVAGHQITGDPQVLRKINLVSPVNNNINLASNDVIKIFSDNNTALKIELASGETSKSFLVPTLIA